MSFSDRWYTTQTHGKESERQISWWKIGRDAGLAILNEGGDFADGLIAHEGRWLGGETFVSFDKRAVALIAKQGQQTKLLT